MSEDQLNSSVTAAKAARRAAIAIAPAAPEPAVPEAIEALVDTATEAGAETAETLTEATFAEAEVVSEAESLPDVTPEAAEEVVTDAVAAAVELPEILAAGSAFASQASRRLQAMSDASAALTRGAQEASRTWLAATQSGMKLQSEGFKRLVACRTPLDLMTAQGELALRGVEGVMEAGQAIARTSTKAIDDAGQALRASA
jgi:hypothetical protein